MWYFWCVSIVQLGRPLSSHGFCKFFLVAYSSCEIERLMLLDWEQCFLLQVPPDFYIPDFDEDEQNPDERVDRKSQRKMYTLFVDPIYNLGVVILLSYCWFQSTPRTSKSREMMNIMKVITTMITIWMMYKVS